MDLSLLPRGAFPVTLDRERVILFDMAATWILQQKYGPRFLPALFTPAPNGQDLQLKDMDAMAFFLYVGLQADAKAHGETVSLEQVQGWIYAWNADEVFKRVCFAVVGNIATPALLGEMRAVSSTGKLPAVKSPAPKNPGPTKVSTMTKRSGSPTPSSVGSRRTSGRSPSGSSRSPAKGTSRKQK